MSDLNRDKGLAVPVESLGSETNLLHRFPQEMPYSVGIKHDVCTGCQAYRWGIERRQSDMNSARASFRNCCKHGAVELPLRYFPSDVGEQVPQFFRDLLSGRDARSRKFREKIQKYNNSLSFTSLGVEIDTSVLKERGPYVFRVSGGLTHKIGSLIPLDRREPGFAQIFIYGGGGPEEAELRVRRSGCKLDPEIVYLFQQFMYANNPYARVFKSALEVCNESGGIPRTLRIKTVLAPGTDHRRYNKPTANEVAAIVEGDGQVGKRQRDIILRRKTGEMEPISELHTAYFALRYPLLFLHGSQMWHEFYRNPTSANKSGKVSNLQWFAYLLFQRPHFSVILASGRLFQEFAVDIAEVYSGAVEALGNEVEDEVVGRRIVLPSSFIGGPRSMQQLYQDAMALVVEYGNPSLFITMTANPDWPEVVDSLEDAQTASDRPDLVARAFYNRFHSMLHDVTKYGRFGVCPAYVYTIEFQKRGLPHAHLILFLDANSRPVTTDAIDCLISAQLPDPVLEPDLYDIVTQNMLHGPCQSYKCWTGKDCKLGYPRPFCERTTLADNSYPCYKRPNNGRVFEKGVDRFDNGSVVPHNRYLLLRYRCHINVEVAASIRAIKYLFKYILKGHDRTMATLECDDTKDEIKSFLDARFLSAPEAVWRLLMYEISGRFPAVQRLSLHLENGQTIYFFDQNGLRRSLETGRAERTTLTEFFRLCQENVKLPFSRGTVRSLKYQDVPKHFAWDEDQRVFSARKNSVISIGRVYFANFKRGDVYYLRLLLCHVPGPTSFAYLRTVNGITYDTFREAADKLGLLLDDKNYHESLTEAATWKTGRQLRHMFAIILCHSSPSNPHALWHGHADDLCDDCEHLIKRLNKNARLSQEHIRNYGLHLLGDTLVKMETNLQEVGMPLVDRQLLFELGIPDEYLFDVDKGVSPDESAAKFISMSECLTREQQRVFEPIRNAIESRTPYLGFVDGPGGTGKTFLLNCILHFCNANDIEFEAVSAAGIAALLLLKGRTAHNAFKIPIPIYEDSLCIVSPGEALGRHLVATRFIVWDEVAMQHRHAVECVDRTLRDLTGIELPFGGKVVLFAGDFRQTLPIVRRSTLLEQARATLKASYLWDKTTKFALSVNIRLGGASATPDRTNIEFAKWLLDLGSGKLQQEFAERVNLAHINITLISNMETIEQQLLDLEYGAVNNLITSRDWNELTNLYAKRCLITPLNATVQELNSKVMNSLPGASQVSVSVDEMDTAFSDPVSIEVLNSFNFPGFPAHVLDLKVGASVMVLRNLHLDDGLCNGTRLLITECKPHALNCRILTGELKGKAISLPKMKLRHMGNEECPIPFSRHQFPVTPAFCMTINKSQGQSLDRVVVLLPNPVFAHGQLYVALSRCTSASNVQVCIPSDVDGLATTNIVFHPVLEF